MALTKDQKDIVSIASQIEKMMTLKGWKSFKKVWDAMYLDAMGGIDKKGNFVGPVKDLERLEDFRYYVGYKQAFIDLWKLGIKDMLDARDSILEQLKEDENAGDTPINPMEREPHDVPNL